MRSKSLLAFSGSLLSLTLLSGMVLSSTNTSANDSLVDNVTITVPEACTITTPSGSGQTYNVSMMNNQYKNDIGKTRLSVFCNNNESFAIYAVGYSNDTFGNTEMIAGSTGTGVTNIPTGTATSGDTSQWAMKLETVNGASGAYTPTIISPFNNFAEVPSSYAKVAEVTSVTSATAEAAIDASYAVFISPNQASGSYTGKVRYTVIHPSSAVPNQPYATDAGKIGYYPNADGEAADTMGDQSIGNTDTSATLWASNFKREDYGFAGWSDKYDWVVNANDTNGNGTGANAGYHIYGPNQTINFTAGQYGTGKGLSLYAVWVKSQGTIQNWNGCGAMSVGQVTALTDTRDGNTYAVAKLRDDANDATSGKCWMIENLRLDNTNSDNTTGALAQGYGTSTTYGNFSGLANPETANFSTTTANSLYYSGTQSGTATINIGTTNYPAYRMPRFNNNNTNPTATSDNPNTTVANMTSTDQNIYSYGNYYTWAAAIADTSYYGVDYQSVTTTSLCPKGWHLPTGGSNTNTTSSDFWQLGLGIMGFAPSNNSYYQNTETNTDGKTAANAIRSYPNNFIYSGYYGDSSASNRGSYGSYWSSTVTTGQQYHHAAYLLRLGSADVSPGTSWQVNGAGRPIRCLAQ